MVCESYVEKCCCDLAETRGWMVRKIAFVGRRDAPDRLFIRRGVTLWVEFKRLNVKPRKTQLHEHAEMRKFGASVEVVDRIEGFAELLERYE